MLIDEKEFFPPPQGEVRRNVEQGSAQRGAGTRLRDATVEPIKGASFQCRSRARLRGQIPRGAPLPPYDAPSKHNALGTCSALRGTFVARLANIDILAAPRSALSTILARTARAFHYGLFIGRRSMKKVRFRAWPGRPGRSAPRKREPKKNARIVPDASAVVFC